MKKYNSLTSRIRYYTADREAGNIIEGFASLADAIEAIRAYEDEDRHDGVYEFNFYSVVDCEGRTIWTNDLGCVSPVIVDRRACSCSADVRAAMANGGDYVYIEYPDYFPGRISSYTVYNGYRTDKESTEPTPNGEGRIFSLERSQLTAFRIANNYITDDLQELGIEWE